MIQNGSLRNATPKNHSADYFNLSPQTAVMEQCYVNNSVIKIT